ncbi:MAG: hypothetical protein HY040_01130 [Planctomycetes bacterium]|nr:hypothetical protein [Planctomycetota bacterium]
MIKYFETEGPFGLPMKDKQAKALDAILRDLPAAEDSRALRRIQSTRGLSELSPESRCDVSWITVETPDHAGDLVLASGMDDSIYQLNPIVTLNHQYNQPPVGRSLWRRKVREGSLVGVKAKTYYLPRPKSWTADEWPADKALDLVKAGLLNGKSIGFLPLQLRAPKAEEIAQNPQLEKVRHIITRWLLLEYACCYLPMQPFALVEQVAKSQAPVTSRRELTRAIARRLASADFERILEKALQRTFQKQRGIV